MYTIEGSRIVVTGGAGGIGSNLVDGLLEKGAREIMVIDDLSRGKVGNLERALSSGRVKFTPGDIRNKELLLDLCQGVDYLFHEAVIRLTLCEENPQLCQEVMVEGTANVLAAAVANKVRKLVFGSSSTVYGEPDYLPIDEKHPLNNQTVYGQAKIAGEKTFEQSGLAHVILRIFNTYGPRMDITSNYMEVIPRWLRSIKRSIPPVIYQDARRSLDFTYVGDVAEAQVVALESRVSRGVYNVGTGVETTLEKALTLLLHLTSSSLEPVYLPSDRRINITRRVANNEKMARELGYKPSTPLREGLQKLIEWYDDPANES